MNEPVLPGASSTPPSYLRPPMSRRARGLMRSSALLLWMGLAALIIGLAIVLHFISFSPALSIVRLSLPTGTEVEFTSGGAPDWYIVDGTTLKHEAGPAAYQSASGLTIVEAVPLASGGTAVLAQLPGKAGDTLGTYKNNTFTPILDDGLTKADLAVSPAGVAIFSEIVPNPAHAKSASASPAFIELVTVDLQSAKPAPHLVAQGRSPRLAPDGATFIALSAQGVISIDPATLGTSLILRAASESFLGAISNDATQMILPSGKALTFYSFDKGSSVPTFLHIFPTAELQPMAFVGDDAYFVRTSATTTALRALPTSDGVAHLGGTFTITP